MNKLDKYTIKFANIQEFEDDDVEMMSNNSQQQHCQICQIFIQIKMIIDIPSCFNQIKASFLFLKHQQQDQLRYFNKQEVKLRNLCKYTLIGIQKGLCQVCLDEDQILYRVNQNCEHVFCIQCLQEWAHYNVQKITCLNSVRCLQDECSQIVDEIILFQIRNSLYPVRMLESTHGILCQKCNTHEISIQIQNGKFQIRNEKIQYLEYNQQQCMKCRTVVCGSCLKYHEQQSQCNFDQLFHQNMDKLGIKSCPQCNQYLQNEDCVELKNLKNPYYYNLIAQCEFCGYQFCWRCSSPASIGGPPLKFFTQEIQPAFIYCNGCYTRFQGFRRCLYQFFSFKTIQIIGTIFFYLAIGMVVIFFSLTTFLIYLTMILLKKILILMYQTLLKVIRAIKQIKNKIGNNLFAILFPIIFALMLVYFILYLILLPFISLIAYCFNLSAQPQELVFDLAEQPNNEN